MSRKAIPATNNSKALLSAIRILDHLAASGRAIGVRQFASELRISRSTCMRLLATLASEHVVEQVAETGRYRLGWRVLALASAYQKSNTLIQISESVLARLTQVTGETCCLYVPAGSGRIVVLQFESPHELRYTAQIGRVYPLYRGAAGKALLAYMSQPTVQRELRACAREDGDESAKRLAEDLGQIRFRGFATSTGENIPGVSGIAVPIFVQPGTAVASLSIYGPSGRVDAATLERLREPVLKAGQDISTALGERTASVPDVSDEAADAPMRAPKRVPAKGR